MPAHRIRASRGWAAAAILVTALALASCGEENADPTVGGAAAPDKAVTEDLKVAALQLEFPEDGVHEEGDDVTLYAALANTGTTDYSLVDVTGPDFADARLLALDGSAGAIEVPENDNTYLEPEGPPSVIPNDLDTALRSSRSIEVTFVFEDVDGDRVDVTMEAPVAADPPGQGGFQAPEDPSGDG